jgi:hypothetical protein
MSLTEPPTGDTQDVGNFEANEDKLPNTVSDKDGFG